MLRVLKYILYINIIFYLALPIYANNNDNLYINSDEAIFDTTNKSAKFSGEVVIWFDDMILKTSELEILYHSSGEKRTIDKIIIPNKLSAIQTSTQNIIIANAAEYHHNNSELILTGDIKLMYQDHIIKTEKLIYYTSLKKIDTNSIK